jgi:hypothetical protein
VFRKAKARPKEVPTIDWEEQAQKRWGTRKLFLKKIQEDATVDQICTLVSLATAYAEEEAGEPTQTYQDPRHQNPLLVGLASNTPLPLSYLNYVIDRARMVPEFDEDKVQQTFNESALVAVGMVLEEMITASLLPLAGLHVVRCRQLERSLENTTDDTMDGPPQGQGLFSHPITGQAILVRGTNVKTEENPFEEWTLPPEEAMLKLLEQGLVPKEGVPLLRKPVHRASGVSTHDAQRQLPIRSWLEGAKGLQPDLVDHNKELFKLFLSGDDALTAAQTDTNEGGKQNAPQTMKGKRRRTANPTK